MTQIIVISIIILVIVLTIINRTYGACIYIGIRILVPENLRLIVGDISLNTAVILIAITISLLQNQSHQKENKKHDRRLLSTVVLFIVWCIVTIPLSQSGDTGEQYKNLLQFFVTELLPIILLLITIRSRKDAKLLAKTFFRATLICCLYGIVTIIIRKNPYLAMYKGEEIIYQGKGWNGISTSSTFIHQNGFGYFLTMSLPFCVYMLDKNIGVPKKEKIVTISLIIICMVLCKKRSALVCGITFGALYVFQKIIHGRKVTQRTVRRIGIIGIILITSVIILYNRPEFIGVRSFLKASMMFWNDKAVTGITTGELGSSWWLRTRQVIYPFVEIKDNLLFGHGFGWCSWYIKENLLHPVLYGFETIFSVSICEFGLFGYPLYLIIFREMYRYTRPYKTKGINYQLLYVFTIVMMGIATGLNYYCLIFSIAVIINKLEVFLHYEKNLSCNCNV